MIQALGAINIVEQPAMSSMPQKAASAWSAFTGGLTGNKYKPIAYIGTQLVKGTNHIFLAQQTLVYKDPTRHIVVVTINEFDGLFQTVGVEPLI